MIPNMNDEQVTTIEAAEILGVSRQRVHQMARRENILPARKDAKHAKRVYWLKSDILRLGAVRRDNLRKVLDRALGGPMI